MNFVFSYSSIPEGITFLYSFAISPFSSNFMKNFSSFLPLSSTSACLNCFNVSEIAIIGSLSFPFSCILASATSLIICACISPYCSSSEVSFPITSL